jgi:flagellar biosynthesis anti-sigma factor FlgM
MMIDSIVNKAMVSDTTVRKGPKPDLKVATSSSSLTDAVSVAKASATSVEVTIAQGNGLSEPPFDYAKVIALKQSIKNGDYKIDYGKLADSMIGTDILNPVRSK